MEREKAPSVSGSAEAESGRARAVVMRFDYASVNVCNDLSMAMLRS
jgi:hypothetical protein